MIDSAAEVFLLVDSTKINYPAFAALNVLEKVDYRITDNGIEEDKLKFESYGIKVIIA
ncbi:MAG: hypothetical protein PF518_09210 [Spirochaetaceae bacterium]|jgi:DeoR/GlpR family transcriptional regulator of sugar metabolism|nr:hypothetical protein [Spirochaetaceae bacterium]